MICTTSEKHSGACPASGNLSFVGLQGRRLILASNRGPLEFQQTVGGRLEAHRGSGGVVTALSSLERHLPVTWVASAITSGDLAVALGFEGEVPTGTKRSSLRIRFVVSPPEQYDLYYNVFANSVLWFVQHNLHDLLPQKDLAATLATAWYNGYRPVNLAFAEAVLNELSCEDAAPLVMLHDYQLYLVAAFIRERAPCVLLHHFVHIPWPEPAKWAVLPSLIVRALCQGLLANDIVGFQTKRDSANFLATCAAVLPEARVDTASAAVQCAGRRTVVRAYPISVDLGALREAAASPQVAAYERRLRLLCCEKTIVRVDRLDPSKNVIAGFEAFGTLLARRPDLRGRVKFLAFLVPSRTGIQEYRRYAQSVFDLVAGINFTFGQSGWQPIDVFYENNYDQAIAGLRLYDVLMINSGLDGMNLVSKEGPIVNMRDGVLVLSHGAGSYAELGDGALGVAPYDVAETSAALEAALEMPPAERRSRARALRQAIERNDITVWLRSQLEDLSSIGGAVAPSGRMAPALSYSA